MDQRFKAILSSVVSINYWRWIFWKPSPLTHLVKLASSTCRNFSKSPGRHDSHSCSSDNYPPEERMGTQHLGRQLLPGLDGSDEMDKDGLWHWEPRNTTGHSKCSSLQPCSRERLPSVWAGEGFPGEAVTILLRSLGV